MTDRIVLIDGHALLYRAFHALQPLSSPKGEPVNAVYGFALMLIKALDSLHPRYLVATFDSGRRTFRTEQYEAYKATRSESPPEFRPQVDFTLKLLEAMKVPVYRVEGFEADDLLGTLARQASEHGLETIILTGDTDALQLVDPDVRVLTSRRGFTDTVLYDEAAVRERYGLDPDQLIDFKALRGDSSDNIPGVPGVGDKTASRLLSSYRTVEGVYAHLADLPDRQRLMLEPFQQQVMLARHLATIVRDVGISLDVEAAELKEFDADRLRDLLYEFGFRSLVDRLPRVLKREVSSAHAGVSGTEAPSDSGQLSLFGAPEPPTSTTVATTGVRVVRTEAAAAEVAQQIDLSSAVSLSVLSGAEAPMRADLVGVGLCAAGSASTYVPIGHSDGANLPPCEGRPLCALEAPLAAERPEKYLHNAKRQLIVLARSGVPLHGVTFDTQIAAYLLDSATRSPELRDVVWKYLQEQLPTQGELTGTGKSARPLAEIKQDDVATLARTEAAVIGRLVPLLEQKLVACDNLTLFRDLEMPLIPVLAAMEMVGVALDVDYLMLLSRDLYQRLTEIEAEIFGLVGHQFSLNAPKQLGAVLFDELNLPRGKKTSTGQSSTGADVLESLSGAHPVVGLILEHRQLAKLKSTYVDALPLLVHPVTGRVHTSYNQTIAATGRLSSSDPNLQNIPIRTELGRKVRRAFIPGLPGYRLLSADYSQIELRVLAHETNDPRLVKAFQEGQDIHAATAAEVMGVTLDQVTPDMRRFAKVVNFGLIYGMSEYGLASRAEIPAEVANSFIQRYFERFGTVKEYQDRLVREATERGYVETLFRRRRYTPDLRSPIYNVRQGAVRQAINHPIQGAASDIMKVAMIRVQDHLREHSLRTRMMLQVHDELVFESPEDEVEAFSVELRRIMGEAATLRVPLDVDIKAGPSWDELTPLAHA